VFATARSESLKLHALQRLAFFFGDRENRGNPFLAGSARRQKRPKASQLLSGVLVFLVGWLACFLRFESSVSAKTLLNEEI
jgi:hypothetical protein